MKHRVINIAYDTTSGLIGGKIGSTGMSLLGSLLGPYGVAFGGLVGAIAGGIWGRRIVSRVKKFIHTRIEVERAEAALKTFLNTSYESSKESGKNFEKKANALINGLTKKKRKFKTFAAYVQKRLIHERRYLRDKIRQLSRARKNVYLLDPESRDIIVAGVNAISLSLRAKVLPLSVKAPMEELINSLESVKDKRNKLF